MYEKWDRSPQNFVAKDLVMQCDETNAKNEGNEGWQPLHTVWKIKDYARFALSSRSSRGDIGQCVVTVLGLSFRYDYMSID